MYNRSQLEAQLKAVQKGCRVRTLSIDDVEEAIHLAESHLQDVPYLPIPPKVFSYITYEQHEQVANSYSSIPYSTHLNLSFTQKGTVKDVTVERTYAGSSPYGNFLRRFWLSVDVFADVFHLNYATHKDACNILRRVWGFNQHLTSHIIQAS